MGMFSRLFGTMKAGAALPGVLQTDEGFLDIDLPIVSVTKENDGTVRISARGLVEGAVVGFAVDLRPTWDPKPIEGASGFFYWGKAAYRRTGEESDRFAALVAKHYGLPRRALTMLREIEAEAVGLDTDPSNVLTSPAKMKFFFHSGSEERYAEVFTNVDVQERRLEFHEKDPEYRVPLVRALTEGT